MSTADFKDAMSALKEVVSAFDFASADMIVKEVSGYAVPAEYVEKFAEIKKAIQAVDQQTVVKLLEEL